MLLSVVVESLKGNGYQARSAEPLAACAEAPTREEALAKLKATVEARLLSGTEVVTLQVGPDSHPWMPFAGMFRGDADFKEVIEIIAENRRQDRDNPSN